MIKHQRNRAFPERRKADHALPRRRLLTRLQRPAAVLWNSGKRARIPWSEVVTMKTILLIDGNAEHLFQHSDLLSRAGYRIVTAHDGRSALFILESGMALDLIVTEYAMPDMESRDFLATIRKEAPSVPVIVVTCCDSVENYIQAINLGVYEYMNKPLLPGELHSIIKTVVDAKRSGSLSAGMA